MIGFGGWMAVAAGLLLLATGLRDALWMRGGIVAAGFVAALGAGLDGRWLLMTAAVALMLISLVHLLLLVDWAGGRLSEEEQRMRAAMFPAMPRGLLRQLLHQGHWIDGKVGERLTEEGQPVSHLFYLSRGEAQVESGGRMVATCRPDNFIGELTVLDGAPATATVTLATNARFWCVTADALRSFLAANRDIAPIVESGFAGNMREKLVMANQRLAAG